MASAFAVGLGVGFLIAAGPGPIFFLVLRRNLARGWPSGLATGLGVATADAIYAALAALGVAVITNVLIAQRRWIGLAGGLAIALIGLRGIIAQSDPAPRPSRRGKGDVSHLGGDYLSVLALTLSNPPTILSFTAVFAGLGLQVSAGWTPALGLVLGVMSGSALWWLFVTAIVALVRERLTPGVTRVIGVASGLVLVLLGIAVGVRSL